MSSSFQCPSQISLGIPQHLISFNESLFGKVFDPADLMRVLIEFGHEHIKACEGGPFVAALQEIKSNKVLCVGANLVVPGNQSFAHGERVAIALGQTIMETYQLPKGLRMLTTAQMCIACYGETLTSGLEEVCASCTGADVEGHTPFKEGVLPHDWKEELLKQGCRYSDGLHREKGIELLKAYGKSGTAYFNAGSSASE